MQLNTTPKEPAMSRGIEEAVRLLEEAIEPGMFGPWVATEDPALANAGLYELCEERGYGAVIHHIEYLWKMKAEKIGLPGSEHSVAACASVRRAWIKEARAALAALKGGGGNG